GGKRLEDRSGVLIGAMLAPQRGEDAQLGQGGRPAQHGLDPPELFGGEVVLADERRRDRRVAGKRGRPLHALDARGWLGGLRVLMDSGFAEYLLPASGRAS